MTDNVLKIGIASLEEYKKRTLAIAKGEYTPKRDEPKIWFESLQSMAQVLSNENQELLRIILKQKPDSLKQMAASVAGKRYGQ
jgi:predicted transcriptional regulator